VVTRSDSLCPDNIVCVSSADPPASAPHDSPAPYVPWSTGYDSSSSSSGNDIISSAFSDSSSTSLDKVIADHQQVFLSGKHNYEEVRVPVQSSWNIDYLSRQLCDYDDQEVVRLLQYGFPVGYVGPSLPHATFRTHKGAQEFPQAVEDYLRKERALGATLGPFTSNPLIAELALSPLNTVDKDKGLGRRVILDLSWPHGSAVNDGIDKNKYLDADIQLTYPTVDSLLDIVRSKGPGCLLFKRDLRRAYRQIPVDPGDIHLLGYVWEHGIYIDRVLPFGLRSAAFICQRVTTALRHIAKLQDVECVNYLDDFGGADTPQRATQAFNKLGDVLHGAGAEESVDKASAPATVMTFLGVEIDTVALEVRIPQDKVLELRTILPSWLRRKKCSRRELQSLIGKLAFICKCVAPGRLFFSRMLNCLRGTVHTSDLIPLTTEFRKDVKWWLAFIDHYNGVSIIKTEPWLDPNILFASDACLVGCGGVHMNQYFHAAFPEWLQKRGLAIAVLECLAVVVAAKLWAHQWSGKRITVQCDNLATVIVINSGRAKHDELLNCLRELAYIAAVNECEFRAVHIPGVSNTAADILSRWTLLRDGQQRFENVFSWANPVNCPVPHSFFKLNSFW